MDFSNSCGKTNHFILILCVNQNIYHTYYNHGNDIIHNHRDVYWLESPTTIIRKVYSG